jgi:hypothetical protein
MKLLLSSLGYFAAVVSGLLAVGMALGASWSLVFPFGLLALVLAPVTGRPLTRAFSDRYRRIVRPLVAIAAMAGIILPASLSRSDSIYRSPAVKARFQEIYATKMADWPVPHEDIFLRSNYGAIHIIESGPDGGQPMLLLHASGVSSWSW